MTVSMDPIVEEIGRDLDAHSDCATRERGSRFFKEPVRLRGVKTATVHAIAKAHWPEVRHLGKAPILALCEDLYRTGYLEDGFIGADWAAWTASAFEPGDIHLLGGWVERYVDNWAACDTLCNHAVGDLAAMYPRTVSVLKEWARSDNRWMRRAAAVSLVVPVKRGDFLADALAIADLLLLDADDMVQKGYGWLLKEASRHHRDQVYAFVLARRAVMPRTALRYAVELMPPELRAEAMRKV